MLSHCANPQCRKPFLRLREGKLFLVESAGGAEPDEFSALPFRSVRKPARRVERYWLCDRCAADWTLTQDGKRGIALVALPQRPVKAGLAMEKARRETA